jgi:DNA-binding transcriptional MerR regulator
MAELARLAGTTARTVRLYLEREIVPRPPFRASATRYERRQLVWLVAALRLRKERASLATIKTRLRQLTAAELEAFAIAELAPGPLAQALGVAPPLPRDAHAADAPRPVRVGPERRWSRLDLALGLELHVRDDVSPAVRALAKRVWRLCIHGEDVPAETQQQPPPPVTPEAVGA